MWSLQRLELTEEHRRTLRALPVDENGPGTIRRDFEALLSFARGRSLPVSKTNQLLPQKVLHQLNALTSRPIEVRLKRPQLKSYPQVQGLYLLLRASGLGQIGGTPSRPVLSIDQQLQDAWSALNPTEQYFALLETWLVRGRPEIIGERDDPIGFLLPQFAGAAELLRRAGSKGLSISDDSQIGWFLNYTPGPMGIAMLGMFGLATVVPRPPQDGEGWIVDRISSTPLGEAVFALLYQEVFSKLATVLEMAEQPQIPPGVLRPVFAPYVPQWQRALEMPSWTFREGRYVFRAALGRSLWRRIAIDAAEPLDALASIILEAFEFDNDHLYEFSYRDRFGVDQSVQHPYLEEGPRISEVRVGEVPLAVGQSMTYLFDFGDQWEFKVTLEQIEPARKPPPRPVILDGYGDAPERYPDWDE